MLSLIRLSQISLVLFSFCGDCPDDSDTFDPVAILTAGGTEEEEIRAARELGIRGTLDDSRPCDVLLKVLTSDDEFVGESAVTTLRLIDVRGKSVARLCKLVDDPRPGISQRALRALKGIGYPAAGAVPQLLALFKAGQSPIQASEEIIRSDEVSEAIIRLDGGGRSVPALIALVKNPDSPRREEAAYLLGRLAPVAADAIPALIEAIQEPHPSPAAAGALAWFGRAAHAAVPRLKEISRGWLEAPEFLVKQTEWSLAAIEGVITVEAPKKTEQSEDPNSWWEIWRKLRAASTEELFRNLNGQDMPQCVRVARELSGRGAAARNRLADEFDRGNDQVRYLAALALGRPDSLTLGRDIGWPEEATEDKDPESPWLPLLPPRGLQSSRLGSAAGIHPAG